MKNSVKWMMMLLVLASLVATGCRKKPANVTPLPKGIVGTVPGGDLQNGLALNNGDGANGANGGMNGANGTPMVGNGHVGWPENRDALKTETVYFAYDSATVRPEEKSKVESVASYLKSNPSAAVRIEGNCDERGTEDYNRALGERRALSVREYLLQSGIGADRVDTHSNGEDKPAEPGHGESAWSKNRRDEFVVLTPP